MGNNTADIGQLLYDAALQNEVDRLEDLLRKDPLVLHRSSPAPYPSPVHVACKHGYFHLMSMLLNQSPSLAEELDPRDKSSPLHVASRNGHLDLVNALLVLNSSMCFARDINGLTPVHVAAIKGHLFVLEALLRTMPASAKELVGPVVGGGDGDTIMHLCVKYKQQEALKKVVDMVGDEDMLNATDRYGNTILHLAVAYEQFTIVDFLLSDTKIEGMLEKGIRNSRDLTAMDIFIRKYKDDKVHSNLKRKLGKESTVGYEFKDWDTNSYESQRNVLMVVASLFATMTYQAGLNPPGGVWQDTQQSNSTTPTNNVTNIQTSHIAGLAIMAQQNKNTFNQFQILNMFGLILSMACILLLITEKPRRRMLLSMVNITIVMVMFILIVAYWMSTDALMPKENKKVLGSTPYVLQCVTAVIGIAFIVYVCRSWKRFWATCAGQFLRRREGRSMKTP